MSLGNISHTSNRIKTEREARKARSQKRRDKTNMYSADNKNALEFKEISDVELEVIKTTINKNIRKEKRKLLIKTLIGSVIILFGIYIILSKIIN